MADEEHEARECMACRGTGRVISNLGGTPQSVTCPWCQGSGVRIPGTDAQARWQAERAAAGDGQREVAAAPAGTTPPAEEPGAATAPGAEGDGESDPPPAAA